MLTQSEDPTAFQMEEEMDTQLMVTQVVEHNNYSSGGLVIFA